MEPPLPPVAMGGQMDDAAPLPIIPLVLQVSPLPGSADWEELFYNPSPDVQNDPFAAAREFFLAQGHEVIVLACPNIAAFQAARPSGASFNSLAALPPWVFTEGYARLQEFALAAIAATTVVAVADDAPVIVAREGFATSLFKRYAEFPSVSLLSPSRAADLPVGPPSGPSSAASLPPGPPSFVGTSVGCPPVFGYAPVGLLPGVGTSRAAGFPAGPPPFGNAPVGLIPEVGIAPSDPSRQPDPDGVDVPASLATSLCVHPSHYGGYSSLSLHHNGWYNPVSPLCHGGASVSSAVCCYGGLPPNFQGRPSVGVFHGQHHYGGFPHSADHAPHVHPTDHVPQVVYGGHVTPHHGSPHVPALVGPHQGFPGVLLVSLAHEDLRSSSASDVTMSLSVAG
jgi:hypothetical protein